MQSTSISKLIVIIYILLGFFKPFEAQAQNFIGIGIAREATHPGSAINETNVLPLVSYSSRGFFVSTVKGVPEFGASWQLTDNFKVSGVLVIEHQRKTTDSNTLSRTELTKKDRSVSIGSLFEYNTQLGPAPVELLFRVRARNGDHDGIIAEQRVTIGVYQNRRMQAQLFAQLSYADKDAMNSDFNLDEDIRSIKLASGVSQASIGLQSAFLLNNNWSLLLSAERKQLRDDAKIGPVGERDKVNQVIAGISYRF